MTPDRQDFIKALLDLKDAIKAVKECRVFRYIDQHDAILIDKYNSEITRILLKESKKKNMYE